MSERFDARITPVRDDLAAARYRGQIERPRYAEGVARQVIEAAVPLRFAPAATARLETELLFGEAFTVYGEDAGWAWGQATRDAYVGYVPSRGLGDAGSAPSHVVGVAASHLYPEPDLKRPPEARLSFESQVRVEETRDGFCRIAGGGWLYAKHLLPVETVAADYVETALQFLGVPYLWGGRTALGLDCSALLQLVLLRAGIKAPRDSDQQAASLGTGLDGGHDLSELRYGDLVFFSGHVGMVLEGWRFLHANAFAMAVTIDGLSDVLDRANAAGEGITAVRRIWLERERRQGTR